MEPVEMPIKYKIIEERKLVYAVGEGQINYADLLGHIDALSADKLYRGPMKKIVDYRNASAINLTAADVKLFTTQKGRLINVFKGERCAVVTNAGLSYDLARMHSAFIGEYGICANVFRNVNEALAWLPVDITEKELGVID